MWTVYKFEKYGEVSVDEPDSLGQATKVENFNDMFDDMLVAIKEYSVNKR